MQRGSLSVSVCLCLSVCLSLSLSIYLPPPPSVSHYVSLSLSLSLLSISPSLCLSFCLSLCLSLSISISFLSIALCLPPSLRLSLSRAFTCVEEDRPVEPLGPVALADEEPLPEGRDVAGGRREREVVEGRVAVLDRAGVHELVIAEPLGCRERCARVLLMQRRGASASNALGGGAATMSCCEARREHRPGCDGRHCLEHQERPKGHPMRTALLHHRCRAPEGVMEQPREGQEPRPQREHTSRVD